MAPGANILYVGSGESCLNTGLFQAVEEIVEITPR